MGWLLELLIVTVSDIFGYQVGGNRPWWVEWVASLGCLAVLAVPTLAIWLLLR